MGSPHRTCHPTSLPIPPGSAEGVQTSREFTCCGVWGHPGGPSPGQAECPVHRWAVPLRTVTPVTACGVDTVLGTAAPSSTAFIHICGNVVSGRGGATLSPLSTRQEPVQGGAWRPPAPGSGTQPHLSGRCRPATLQGSDSGLAGHSSLRSGMAGGILLWGEARHQLRRVPRAPQGWHTVCGGCQAGFESRAARAWPGAGERDELPNSAPSV